MDAARAFERARAAHFAMLASSAGRRRGAGFASIRVLLPRRFAAVAAVIALCGMRADGWIHALPLVGRATQVRIASSRRRRARWWSCRGSTTGDLAALYRSIYHTGPS